MSSGIFYPAVSGDDGYVNIGGAWNGALNNIIFGYNWGSYDECSFRFPSVNIPQGATILSAFVRFTGYSNCSGTTCNVKLHLNAADDAVAPTTLIQFNALALTTGVAWNDVGAWVDGVQYDTLPLVTEVQAVVDRGGWASGQAMQLVIKENGSTGGSGNYGFREASAREYLGGAEKAELHLEWIQDPTEPEPNQACWNPSDAGSLITVTYPFLTATHD